MIEWLKQKRVKHLPKIGFRIIKTTLAILLSTLIVGYGLGQIPMYASIGAAVAIDNTMEKSFRNIINRNIGTVVGAVIGVIALFITEELWILALGVLPVIYIMNMFKRSEAVQGATVVYLSVVFLNTADKAWYFGMRRAFETILGSVIGILVNILIKNPEMIQKGQKNEAEKKTRKNS